MATVDRNGQTKRQKQEAKLTLAGQDRAARNAIEPGRYAIVIANINELPAPYHASNDGEFDPGASTLKQGRPWV